MIRVLHHPLHFILLLLALSHWAEGQTLQTFKAEKRSLESNRVSDVFPVGPNQVWLRQDMPQAPALLNRDTVRYYPAQETGFNPYSNPLIGAYPSFSGTQWLVTGRLPGWIEGPFGPSNGGLVRLQSPVFTIYNSVNFPPFSSFKERIWYCSAMQPDGQKIWVGGDAGIRSLDLGTLQHKLFFGDSVRDLSRSYWRRGKTGKTGVWFSRDRYEWVYQSGDTLKPLRNSALQLPDSLVLKDIEFLGADTFLLTADRLPGGKTRLWKRNGFLFSIPVQNASLDFMAIERGSRLWFTGRSGMYRFEADTLLAQQEYNGAGKTPSCFKIDGAGNKWIGTLDSGLYKLNNLKARIVFPNGRKQTYCYSEPVSFSASVQSLGGQNYTYQWFFGDGKTGSGANPTHFYGWTGRFRVRLRVEDEFGARLWVEDTLHLEFKPNVYMLPNRDTLVTCEAYPLTTTAGSPVQWVLPDGSLSQAATVAADAPGWYRFDAPGGGCRVRDSIYVMRRPLREGTIELRTATDSILVQTDSFETLLPVVVRAREKDGYCSSIWSVNGQVVSGSNRAEITFSQAGRYEIEVASTSYSNCRSISKGILLIKEKQVPEIRPLEVPNLVLRTGKPENRKWQIRGGQGKYRVRIIDRWGKAVFDQEDYQGTWPDSADQEGVYFFSVQDNSDSVSGWLWVK